MLREVERGYPQFGSGREARVRSLREALFGPVRTPLLMLLAATGCVLLLACANLAHLFMARLGARRREFAVRLAIGASRGRLIRLLTIEATIFAITGGLAALVFARWTFDLIMSRTPEFAHIYRLLPAGLDYRVVGFAATLAAVALAIFGVVPAVRASRPISVTASSMAAPRRARRGDDDGRRADRAPMLGCRYALDRRGTGSAQLLQPRLSTPGLRAARGPHRVCRTARCSGRGRERRRAHAPPV